MCRFPPRPERVHHHPPSDADAADDADPSRGRRASETSSSPPPRARDADDDPAADTEDAERGGGGGSGALRTRVCGALDAAREAERAAAAREAGEIYGRLAALDVAHAAYYAAQKQQLAPTSGGSSR